MGSPQKFLAACGRALEGFESYSVTGRFAGGFNTFQALSGVWVPTRKQPRVVKKALRASRPVLSEVAAYWTLR